MFDFQLIHVPAEKHKGPDALSRRTQAEDEKADPDDDSWLDSIALLTIAPERDIGPFNLTVTPNLTYSADQLPSCLAARASQELMLNQTKHFLGTLEAPRMDTVQKKR